MSDHLPAPAHRPIRFLLLGLTGFPKRTILSPDSCTPSNVLAIVLNGTEGPEGVVMSGRRKDGGGRNGEEEGGSVGMGEGEGEGVHAEEEVEKGEAEKNVELGVGEGVKGTLGRAKRRRIARGGKGEGRGRGGTRASELESMFWSLPETPSGRSFLSCMTWSPKTSPT